MRVIFSTTLNWIIIRTGLNDPVLCKLIIFVTSLLSFHDTATWFQCHSPIETLKSSTQFWRSCDRASWYILTFMWPCIVIYFDVHVTVHRDVFRRSSYRASWYISTFMWPGIVMYFDVHVTVHRDVFRRSCDRASWYISTFMWPCIVIHFDVHVTVHRDTFLTIKPTRCTNYSNLFLEWNFTCFGQFLCPSSGVFHCTYCNGICHTGLRTACEPACKLSANRLVCR